MRFFRVGLLLIGLVMVFVAVQWGSAENGGDPLPRRWEVDDNRDAVDINPGDGLCVSAFGTCTLRAAIMESNAWPATDEIGVRPNTYILGLCAGDETDEDLAACGDLDILDDVLIEGGGDTSTIIDANQIDRIFHIIGAIEVEIANLTLQNGNTRDDEDGGAIFNSSNAVTILRDSIVQNNTTALWGGGIANDDSASIQLDSVHILSNTARLLGGGIDNHDGIVTMTGGSVVGNVALTKSGGGIYNDGLLRMTQVLVMDNSAELDGGGIFNFDSLELKETAILQNSAGGDAGGVLNWGDLVAQNITIGANTAGRDAGGLFNLGTADLLHVTVYQNTAGGVAGGLFQDGELTLQNSIIANNMPSNCLLWHTIDSLGHNIESADTCELRGRNDMPDTDPLLGELEGNPPFGYVPQEGSPAINAIVPDDVPPLENCLNVDQKGMRRPQGAGCDIGAIEVLVADLVLMKSAEPNPVDAGSSLIYQLDVTNRGDSATSNVVVTDMLPAGTVFVGATGTGWSCGEAAGVVTCVQTLAPVGELPPIFVEVTAPDEGGTIVNSAAVDSVLLDDRTDDNVASVAVDVTAVTDLAVFAESSPVDVEQGQPLSFTVSAENYGASTAQNVTIEIPVYTTSQFNFVSAMGAGWTCDFVDSTVVCTLSMLPVGVSAPITVVIEPTVGDEVLMADVLVASDTVDRNVSNNATVAVLGAATTSRSDLSINVNDSADPVFAGESFDYVVTVANAGPNSAEMVVTTIMLPESVTYVSAIGDGWACVENGGVVDCSRAVLPTGNAPEIVIIGTAPADAQTVTATANVSAQTVDQNPANNAATEQTTIAAYADVRVAMAAAPDPVSIGQSIFYTLTVTNDGPSAATALVLSQTLPAEVFVENVVDGDWTCGAATGSVACDLATLAAGALTVIVVEGSVTAAADLVSQVVVGAATADGFMANNSAEITVSLAAADLSLTIADDPDPVAAGALVQYDIEIDNAGPAAAEAVVVDLVFADDALLESVEPPWVCAGSEGVYACELATIAPGTAPTLRFTRRAIADAGTIDLSATVRAQTADADPSNNVATETTEVFASADLQITVTGDDAPIVPGATFNYTIAVENTGVSPAEMVVVSQPIPSGMQFVEAAGTGWTCVESGNVLTCSLPSLAVAAAPPIAVTLQATATDATVLIPVEVAATTFDPNESNNQATVVLGSADVVDLSIDIAESLDPVDAGQTTRLEVTVGNAGPGSAENVAMRLELPPNAQLDNIAWGEWNCEVDQLLNVIDCTYALLPPGANGLFLWVDVVGIDSGGIMRSEATVSSSTTEAAPDNNSVTESTTVIPAADLAVAIENVERAGTQINYDLAVQNDGPSISNNVVVTHTWPESVTFYRATGFGWLCQTDGFSDELVCTRTELLSGQASTINVTAFDPSQSVVGELRAEVVGDAVDRDLSNNVATAVLEVGVSADVANLALSLQSPASVETDDPFALTATVQNFGDDAATMITATIGLPSAAVYDAAAGDGWLCERQATTVVCTRINGAVGTLPVITIDLTAPASAGVLSFSGSVAAATLDPVPQNNAATATTTVGQGAADSADLALTLADHPDPVGIGETLTFTHTVTNNGTDAANAVELIHTLSSQVAFVGAVGEGWTCDYVAVDHRIDCNRGQLANGEAANVIVTVTAPMVANVLVNQAIVTAATHDPDLSNNTASEQTQVVPHGDLSVAATAPAQVEAGASMQVVISVVNGGPSAAAGVVVNGAFSAQSTLTNVSAPDFDCSHSQSTLTCETDSLAVGTTEITVNLTAPAEPGLLESAISITSETLDLVPTNNEAATETAVGALSGLAVTVSDGGGLVAGEVMTYSVGVENLGPSSADFVTVTLDVPAPALVYDSFSGTGWACLVLDNTVTCTYENLAVGTAPPLEIYLLVVDDTATVDLSVTVTGSDPDPDPSDNSATITSEPARKFIYLPLIQR